MGNIETGRPNLGQLIPLSVYRSLQYSLRHVLAEEFGVDFADTMLFRAGKTGREFSVKEIDCWGTGGRACRFLVNYPYKQAEK